MKRQAIDMSEVRDETGSPVRPGIYLARWVFADPQPQEIEVYSHPVKGLCCFSEEVGSAGTLAVDDRYDCHVSIQCTGLEFITRVEKTA